MRHSSSRWIDLLVAAGMGFAGGMLFHWASGLSAPAVAHDAASADLALRFACLVMVGFLGLFFALVVFGNVTDYGTNFAFVTHVLSMDTIEAAPNSSLRRRAITSSNVHHVGYACIIAWEAITCLLCLMGAWRLWLALYAAADDWQAAKALAILAMLASATLWFGGFVTIGGEYFAMWLSPKWNGQPVAMNMTLVSCLVLVLLASAR